jgi:hypothetical protein
MTAYLPPRPAERFQGPEPELVDQHHVRCPICGDTVDRRDADALARHLEPGHQPPPAATS